MAKAGMTRTTDEPINIVMCTDDRFVLPFVVAVTSILRSADPSDRFVLFVVDGGITDSSRERIESHFRRSADRLEIRFLLADLATLDGLHEFGHLNRSTYLRLQIPSLLPPEIDKVIFLDCDLIVRKSLRELWNVSLGPAPLAAVIDQYIERVGSDRGLARLCGPMALDGEAHYFNGGVTVMNVKAWRSEPIVEAIFDVLRQHVAHLPWLDQDAMNAVLVGRTRFIDDRWNFQSGTIKDDPRTKRRPSLLVRRKRIKEAYIVHYTGSRKPWLPTGLDPERTEFLKYLLRSRWLNPAEFAALIGKGIAKQTAERIRRKVNAV